MKIQWSNTFTWNDPDGKIWAGNGYGYATERCLDSLERLGYQVGAHIDKPDVHLWFEQPHHIEWTPGAYRIAYLPWESTQLLKGWKTVLNTADEVWTPSPLIAKWFADDGVNVPIYVYEHGVDHVWEPVQRTSGEPIKFLHLGIESARKGGYEVQRSFKKVFGNDPKFQLTLKMVNEGWNIKHAGNVNYLNDKLSASELVELFQSHHAYVYPSWGEGFGLTPLQAMATGMPTITLPAWAPYARFLDPHLQIDSTLTQTPAMFDKIHPGQMFKPDLKSMQNAMRYLAENYEDAQDFAQSQVAGIKDYYDWDKLTKITFENLAKRVEK